MFISNIEAVLRKTTPYCIEKRFFLISKKSFQVDLFYFMIICYVIYKQEFCLFLKELSYQNVYEQMIKKTVLAVINKSFFYDLGL